MAERRSDESEGADSKPAPVLSPKGLPEDVRLLREKISYALRTSTGMTVRTESAGCSVNGVNTGSISVFIGSRLYLVVIEPIEGP